MLAKAMSIEKDGGGSAGVIHAIHPARFPSGTFSIGAEGKNEEVI